MKSVYSAVRTGALNKAVCASSLKGSFSQWTPTDHRKNLFQSGRLMFVIELEDLKVVKIWNF
jgi:hypothetical protein